jgi:ornithine carbamoyltransferase
MRQALETSYFPPPSADVLALAARVQSATRLGMAHSMLQGKNIGVLCHVEDERMMGLRRAILDLGGRPATLRLSLWNLETPQEVQRLTQLLGRLYDAVICLDVAGPLRTQIVREAGVPVCIDLADDPHACDFWARRLVGVEPVTEKHRFVMQATLLAALG